MPAPFVLPSPSRYGGVTGVSSAHGTFGELLQGALPTAGGDFLVTLPIARWSVATFRGDPASRELRVRPAHKRKALRLLEMIMEWCPAPMGGELTLDSALPEGKGLASSSADLVAAARAVGNALRVTLTPQLIESFLRRIEPTDGVLYPGIVAYYHRRVRLRSILGDLPQMVIVSVDEGGQVDTVEYNRIPKSFSAAVRSEYAGLLESLSVAVARGDLATVGAVATRSAVLNQDLRPKTMLAPVIEICHRVGGLGVATAHSGTTSGILLDPADAAFADRLTAAAKACTALAGNATVYRSLSFDNGRRTRRQQCASRR
jgi:L-threonine kinase